MAGSITRRKVDGYDIYAKSDGVEYWHLVKPCIDAHITRDDLMRSLPEKPPPIVVRADGFDIKLTPMAFLNPKRMVFRLDVGYRTYVLKWARIAATGLQRFLPWTVGLTYFSRIMRQVDRAVMSGCRATQECLLVAEKPASTFRQNVWVLFEYIEGDSLGYEDEPDRWRFELRQTAEELIRHGLTLDDLTPHNFLIADGKIRAIDISCRPFTRLQAVKMAMKMNTRYGLDLPITGAIDKGIRFFLDLRYRLRRATGGAE